VDRRIQKTRQEIKEAFVHLLQQKSFDDLTITDLTEQANINRTTFYKHFEDKHDLLAFYEEELLENVKMMMTMERPFEVGLPLEEQQAFHALVEMYRYINEERALIEVMLQPTIQNAIIPQLQYLLEKFIAKNLLPYKQPDNPLVSKEIVVVYQAAAHLGVMRHWITKKLAYAPEEMAMMVMNIMMEGPFTVLKRSQKF